MIRKNCISCGCEISEDVVIVGNQYPSAIFVRDGDVIVDSLEPTSLNVAKCLNDECGLVQLSNEYDLQYVFDHYPYESSSTATMKQILQNTLDGAFEFVKLSEDDVVLDIGGNDGTLLGLIKESIKARVNIDAAAGVKQLVNDDDYIHVHSKFSAEVYNKLNLLSPKLIFSTAMFYHLNDPLTFSQNVADIMDDDSVWVLQLTYLGTMLRDNILDNIVHEHTAYYSLASLEFLLSQVGLHVAEAGIVKSYGGSLRVYITKNPVNWKTYYHGVQRFERENKTNTFDSLNMFNDRIQLLRKSIKAVVEHITQIQGGLWGFGASTKGNMLLQFLGIDSKQISCILDNNDKKIGAKTLGTKIPIVEEAVHLENLPKYLMVLPYYYVDAFVKIIKKHLKPKQKVYLLVPLPYPYFIEVTNE